MFEHVDGTGLGPEQVAEVQRFASLLRVSADPADGSAMAAWQLDRSRLQAVLDGVSLAATVAFESSLVWAADGARSPAAWLAANTATTRVAALRGAGADRAQRARRPGARPGLGSGSFAPVGRVRGQGPARW